ncbi:hypothetical protein ENUP19_0252G0048 [Entamoeba nuttalli]|uniref:protein-tyrosine-phosphatase n=1 Tax=Entamoeba nuttalli TaxID=412467 RepID=A0ABQ0DRN2_9EUKA
MGNQEAKQRVDNIELPLKEGVISTIIENELFLTGKKGALLSDTYELNHIKALVVVCPEQYEYPINKEEVEILKLPVIDSYNFPLINYLEKAYEFIDSQITQHHPVLVHCDFGISRSASVVIAYLIRKYQMSLKAAFQYVSDRRHIVCPNPAFIMQLYEWQRKYHSCIGNDVDALYIKQLLSVSSILYRDVPSKSLWNAFVDSKFDFADALKSLRKQLASRDLSMEI